jgi:hypothetical protein
MRKTKSFLHKNRRSRDTYKTFCAIVIMLLLIPTTVALGKTTAPTGTYDKDDSTGSLYVFRPDPREDTFFISITGGLGVSAIIMNNGTTDATGVAVTLHVEGGVFRRINTTITDTVNIPARGVAVISTGKLLGLGRVTITASANTTEKTAQGIQLLLFSKVLDDTWNWLAESK